MKSFAIVLVCYKRLTGIKRLLNSLNKVDYDDRKDITLIFSIDNSGDKTVEEYANKFKWNYGEKIVRTFDDRQGLKKHILKCGDYTEQYDIVAILEDDILVSNSFYNYSYQAAEFYWDDENIAGISLYGFQKNWLRWPIRFEPQKTSYDSYFLKVAQSWGEVWTRNKWQLFMEWYSENQEFKNISSVPKYLNEWPESSWLKYHDRYCIETNRYFVYPYVSLSTNCSDAGEHSYETVNDHQVELQYDKSKFIFPEFSSDSIIYDEYMNREHLGKYIGIDDEDLTVDFWGTNKLSKKKYLLTTKCIDYKIIRKYALSLRPIEASVIYELEGDGIFLYDTSIPEKNRNKVDDFNVLLYSLRTHDWRVLMPFSIKLTFSEIKKSIKRRLRK